jgi:SPP1 gp7 family putative phage head morphogenesis protein
MKLERYQALLGQLDVEVAKYVDWGVLEIIDRERLLGQLGIQHAVESVQLALVEAGKGMGEFFNRVPISAVEKMVGMTAGGPLEGLLSEAYPLAAEQMTQALIEGVALGLPPGEVAKRMADGMAAGLNRCTVIARTEILRVYRETSRQQYEESGAVERFERLATRQPNTCMACIALDGEIYLTKELMNVHPLDRCTMLPLVRGVPRPERELASEWFERQDSDLQKEMMGPGRHKLYKEGKIDLPDLVTKTEHPVWGPSVGVTPLKNLGVTK